MAQADLRTPEKCFMGIRRRMMSLWRGSSGSDPWWHHTFGFWEGQKEKGGDPVTSHLARPHSSKTTIQYGIVWFTILNLYHKDSKKKKVFIKILPWGIDPEGPVDPHSTERTRTNGRNKKSTKKISFRNAKKSIWKTHFDTFVLPWITTRWGEKNHHSPTC